MRRGARRRLLWAAAAGAASEAGGDGRATAAGSGRGLMACDAVGKEASLMQQVSAHVVIKKDNNTTHPRCAFPPPSPSSLSLYCRSLDRPY